MYNGMKIDLDKVVVLEFGGFTELVEKVRARRVDGRENHCQLPLPRGQVMVDSRTKDR